MQHLARRSLREDPAGQVRRTAGAVLAGRVHRTATGAQAPKSSGLPAAPEKIAVPGLRPGKIAAPGPRPGSVPKPLALTRAEARAKVRGEAEASDRAKAAPAPAPGVHRAAARTMHGEAD